MEAEKPEPIGSVDNRQFDELHSQELNEKTKMEFTKEEVKTAKKLLEQYKSQKIVTGFTNYLNSLLKPERKKIIVEIEYFKPDGCPDMQISYIKSKLEYFEKDDFVKITELPEMFTREDMIDFALYSKLCNMGTDFDNWLSERKSK